MIVGVPAATGGPARSEGHGMPCPYACWAATGAGPTILCPVVRGESR